MTEENQHHVYCVKYNLCSEKSLTGLGCADYRGYIRTKAPLDETAARKRFGKEGFELTLYSLEKLNLEQVRELGFDSDAIPIID